MANKHAAKTPGLHSRSLSDDVVPRGESTHQQNCAFVAMDTDKRFLFDRGVSVGG